MTCILFTITGINLIFHTLFKYHIAHGKFKKPSGEGRKKAGKAKGAPPDGNKKRRRNIKDLHLQSDKASASRIKAITMFIIFK